MESLVTSNEVVLENKVKNVVFLSFFSLLVSILGIPLSCLQMIYVEHDPATKLTKIIPLGVLKKNFIVLKRLEIQDGCPGL
jgi:hypothetical protein